MSSPDEQHFDEPRPTTTLVRQPPSPDSAPARVSLLPPEPANQQRSVAALFVSLLSLAGLLGLNDAGRGVYVAVFALLAGVVALWLALTAIFRARRARTRRPHGCVTATVIAGIGILLSAAMLLAFAVLGRQLSNYDNCLGGANTLAAQHACQHQFTHAVNQEITTLRSGGTP